jgi:WhiB family redox-sensing transcriptional regulator
MAQSWRTQGRCRGTDPAIFYPSNEEDGAAAVEAKEICSTCPVRTPCLEHALAVREKFGVWGGLTERERRRMLRQRRRTA